MQYLSDTGALSGTSEDIAVAKLAYRREYKRRWKHDRLIKPIELRPGFTTKQYKELQIRAHEFGLTPTGYIKQLAVSSIENQAIIPYKPTLLKVLQQISMSVTTLPKGFSEHTQLSEAETLLLNYLNNL
jgi:hypothetical protein